MYPDLYLCHLLQKMNNFKPVRHIPLPIDSFPNPYTAARDLERPTNHFKIELTRIAEQHRINVVYDQKRLTIGEHPYQTVEVHPHKIDPTKQQCALFIHNTTPLIIIFVVQEGLSIILHGLLFLRELRSLHA